MSLNKIFVLIIPIGLLTACGYSKLGMGCNMQIDIESISNSCNLENGVFFEKLTVIKLDTTGLPLEFKVGQRFECLNPGVEGVQTYWPNEIFFKKQNEHYRWRSDTVDLHFVMDGKVKILAENANKRDENDSLKVKEFDFNSDAGFGYAIPKRASDIICPVEFKPSTWYFLYFFKQRYLGAFLYVDENMKFNLHVLMSDVSPI